MEVATIIEVVTKGNELAASNRPELLCGFCYDTYRDPRILPCGHTFCLQCLNKNMKTNGNNQRQTCGLCRQHWSVPEEGLSGLPKNFALREACPEPDSPPVRRCAMEGEGSKDHGDVKYFCADCSDALCAPCFDGHRRTELTKKHTVIPISPKDIMCNHVIAGIGDDTSNNALFDLDLALQACSIHADLTVTQYCLQCDDVICHMCSTTSHAGHTCLALREADKAFSLKIDRLLADLRDKVKERSAALKTNTKSAKTLRDKQAKLRSDVEDVINEAKSKIQEMCEKIIKDLELCKTAALTEIGIQVDNERTKLDKGQKASEDKVKVMQQIISACDSQLTSPMTIVDRWQLAKKLTVAVDDTGAVESFTEDGSCIAMNNKHKEDTMPEIGIWKTELASWQDVLVQALSSCEPAPHLRGSTSISQQLVHTKLSPSSNPCPFTVIALSRVIVLPQLKICNRAVDVVSVLNDSLLVSDYMAPELYIYSLQDSSSRTLPLPGMMRHAVWLPNGNIICTTGNNSKVTTLSNSGHVIRETPMTDPHNVSVHAGVHEGSDAILVQAYLADSEKGVYESRDSGVTWNLLFKLPDPGWHCSQVIKVHKEDGSDVFWALESHDGAHRLREYTLIDNGDDVIRHPESRIISQEINTSPSPGVHIDLHYAHLAYDGATCIFISDFNNSTVHLFSPSGDHVRQLLTSRDGLDGPRSLAVDKGQKLLCVGQRKGEVKIFLLMDGLRSSMRMSSAAKSMCEMVPSSSPSSSDLQFVRRQISSPADFNPDSLNRRRNTCFDFGSMKSAVRQGHVQGQSASFFVPTSIARRPSVELGQAQFARTKMTSDKSDNTSQLSTPT